MKYSIPLFISFCLLFSCNDDKISNAYEGTWKLTNTSGGIANIGYDANFDMMKIDQNMNFELLADNNLVANGQIITDESMNVNFPYRFEVDVRNITQYIDFIDDSEKNITVEDNFMNVRTACCDRFETTLQKQ